MQIEAITAAALRDDDALVRRTIQACEEEPGGGGMQVGVCNEFGTVYLQVETCTDAEFIQVVSCLESLGFADVTAARPERDRYHAVMSMP